MRQMGAPSLAFFARLLVSDIARSLSTWERLGFALIARDATFLHLHWPSGGDVLLVPTPAGLTFDSRRGAGVLLSFSTAMKSVESLASRAEEAGLTVEGPTQTPWHTNEIIVVDPDGYRLNFLEPAR